MDMVLLDSLKGVGKMNVMLLVSLRGVVAK